MRRLSLSWFLPLLLVIAQHGALLHELSHLRHVPQAEGVSVHADAELLDNAPCLTCEAFAQVSSPIAGQSVTFDASPVEVVAVAAPRPLVISAATPTPRSRGPPLA